MVSYVDTNVFVRLLVRDSEQRYLDCLAYFRGVEGGVERATTSEAIVAEIFYVLTSPRGYHLTRPQAVSRVRPLLEMPGIHLDHKTAILAAIDMFSESTVDFEDCLVAVHAERLGVESIMSYDRALSHLSTIPRREPRRET